MVGELAGPTDPDDVDFAELGRHTTYFFRNAKGAPILYDYHVMGFLKEAASALNGRVAGGVKNLRSKVENLVFVSPVEIPLIVPAGQEPGLFERPCRRRTPHGQRVFIACSETMPAETRLTAGISVYPGEINQRVLEDLLDWGFHHGMGQWRTGGWGRFRYTLRPEK
jgi:hypothetical protein